VVDAAEIVRRLDELEKRFATAEHERDEYKRLYLETMERCRKLELGLLSSKSEHLPKDDSQLSLDVLTMVLDERQRAELEAALAATESGEDVRAHKRRKPTGRKPIPEHLPRVEIQVLPPEVEREGLDAFEKNRRGSQRNHRAPSGLARRGAHRPAEVRAKESRA
jgi:transposase